MKVLVTGGAGFIGSHVANACLRAGHEVVVVDNLSGGRRKWVDPRATLYVEDILSDGMLEILQKEKPDIVNHHAAQKSVPISISNPVLDAQLNIVGLLKILQKCQQTGVAKFIFASSGGALTGDADIFPTPETWHPICISPYAISKYAGEQYVAWFCEAHNIRWTTLRYANVYGPRQTASGEAGVVPIYLDNLLSNRPSFIFAKPNAPLGTVRDYVYVSDVAEANLIALEHGDDNIFHIGTGTSTYTADVYHKLARVVGQNTPLCVAPSRDGDVFKSCLDISKAHTLLGWKPRVDLDTGLKRTYEYYIKTQSANCK